MLYILNGISYLNEMIAMEGYLAIHRLFSTNIELKIWPTGLKRLKQSTLDCLVLLHDLGYYYRDISLK